MPRLSDSMEEGTIVRWLKQDGEQVSEGEPVAEARTEPGSQPSPARGAVASENGARRVKASPLARRIARESGIDLSALSGSGPGGRIVRADLETAAPATALAAPATAPAAPAAPATSEPAAPARGNKGAVTIQQLSRTQVQIAQRMAESKATIPDFTLHVEVDMEQAVALRDQLRKATGAGDFVPSYNDLVVKACALALREHPRANAAYRDGAFELYERVNVGIAVAAEDSLIVPTVFDADRKSLLEIARESRALADRVRERQITPAELSGATFTVSNLGMYGVASFAAIINPPQAAILAVGELRETPVVRDGSLAVGTRMSLVLTCDHRILYGAPAAEFLARVRQLLEQPLNLLL